MKTLQTKVDMTIQKPIEDVFRAVQTPAPFFVKSASGPLKEGQKVSWEFPEFAGAFPVHGTQVIPLKMIRFQWEDEGEKQNDVEFTFVARGPNETTVTVVESGWHDTDDGRTKAMRNTGGWMNMLSCLKAYLEHGINLRKGAFVHMMESGS